MSQPSRNASPESILASKRVFFATTKTSMGRRLFQTERNADLLVDVLRALALERGFSEVQVLNKDSFVQHQAYIAKNPVFGKQESGEG
jgi:hypothetical protein